MGLTIDAQSLLPQKQMEWSKKQMTLSKIKQLKKTTYSSLEEMNIDLKNFLVLYNLHRRHGSLRRELKVKTPFNAIEKWYELNPEIFNEKPSDFKIKILNLKIKNTSFTQQPCET